MKKLLVILFILPFGMLVSQDTLIHVVKKNENLKVIAVKYDVSTRSLKTINSLNSYAVSINDSIKVYIEPTEEIILERKKDKKIFLITEIKKNKNLLSLELDNIKIKISNLSEETEMLEILQLSKHKKKYSDFIIFTNDSLTNELNILSDFISLNDKKSKNNSKTNNRKNTKNGKSSRTRNKEDKNNTSKNGKTKAGSEKTLIIQDEIEYKKTYKNLKDSTKKYNNNQSTLKIDSLDIELEKNDEIDHLVDIKKQGSFEIPNIQEKDTSTVKDESIKLYIAYNNEIDTSKVSKDEKEKFLVKTEKEEDFIIEADVKTAVVQKSKKKSKYSYGDEVDRVSKEKSKFLLERAIKEIEKGNINKADDYISKSLKLNPSYIDAYILKGDIFSSLNYFDRALIHYYRASYLDPENAQLYYNLGNCFLRLGKDREAKQEWSKAIKIDNKYILAYVGRASLYIKEKRYKRAIADYDKIFEINKYFYPALRNRGVAYAEQGEFGKAIIDFNNYLEYEPDDSFVLYHRGLSKLYDNDIYEGCMDLWSSSQKGFKLAGKAIKKHCEN